MILVCRRAIRVGNEEFPCGSMIEPHQLGRNYENLIRNRYAAWQPFDAARTYPVARTLPKSEPPPPPNPTTIVLSKNPDPLLAWPETKAGVMALGFDAKRAADLILAAPGGSDQWLRFTKADYDRQSRGVRRPTGVHLVG